MNSSDYFHIKLRSYASPYMLNKFHKGDLNANKAQMDAARKIVDFFWKLVEEVTGHDSSYYYLTYKGFGKEYAVADLYHKSGICIAGGEGWYYYIIPKQDKKLIKWFLDNSSHIKQVVLKRNRYTMYFEHYESYLPVKPLKVQRKEKLIEIKQ